MRSSLFLWWVLAAAVLDVFLLFSCEGAVFLPCLLTIGFAAVMWMLINPESLFSPVSYQSAHSCQFPSSSQAFNKYTLKILDFLSSFPESNTDPVLPIVGARLLPFTPIPIRLNPAQGTQVASRLSTARSSQQSNRRSPQTTKLKRGTDHQSPRREIHRRAVWSCETSDRLVDRLETPSRTQYEPNSRSNKRSRARTVRAQTRATP
ncbi:hypothetical protein LXL04_033887 [Taraxacum kok-saghyz]